MQSWGSQSLFSHRDTEREPTKSGMLGLVGAAMGMSRSDGELLRKLTNLSMGVRVDREGTVEREYQTAGGGEVPENFLAMHGVKVGRGYGVPKASGAEGETVLSERFYLADAVFLVALSGEKMLLEQVAQGFRNPVWPLFLGRKSYLATQPFLVRDGLKSADHPKEALVAHPFLPKQHSPKQERMRLVLETTPEHAHRIVHDVPLDFAKGHRVFAPRHVMDDFIPLADLPQERPCT